MGVHYVTGGAGSPGVTTTALGLTMVGSAPALLVDASRDASQAIVAGFLHGASVAGTGLEAFARDLRMGTTPDLERSTLALDGAGRRLLPGFGHLGAVELFSPMWEALAQHLRRLADSGVRVVVDGGRFTSMAHSEALVRCADRISLVTRTSLRHLSATSAVCAPLEEAVGHNVRAVRHGLVVVGEGQPYTSRDIAAQFGWPIHGLLPFLPDHARVLSDGGTPPRRWQQSPLLEALARLSRSERAIPGVPA